MCAEILALVDRELLEGVYSGIASGDRAAAIASLSKLTESGEDPRHVLKEFIGLLRRLLLLSAGARTDVAESDRERLTVLARAMPYENLLRGLSLAVEADQLGRKTEEPGLVLQMLVLRLAELPRLTSIEQALSGVSGGSRGPGPSAVREEAPPPPPRARAEGPRVVSIVRVEPEPEEEHGRAAKPGSDEQRLGRFLELLGTRRRVTAAQVSLAESTAVEGDELVLRFPIDKAPAKEALEDARDPQDADRGRGRGLRAAVARDVEDRASGRRRPRDGRSPRFPARRSPANAPRAAPRRTPSSGPPWSSSARSSRK